MKFQLENDDWHRNLHVFIRKLHGIKAREDKHASRKQAQSV